MHHRLPLLATRIFNEPHLIHPGKAAVIVNVLRDRLGIGDIVSRGPDYGVGALSVMDLDDDDDDDWAPTPYDTSAGIALIPVEGTLVHKNGTVRPSSGMTGYDGISNAFLAAQRDDAVRAIALHIDSPGGDGSGCFDLVDMIHSYSRRAGGGGKPCWAILDEQAYSAAYAIASAADRIVVPRTGGAGSIGVIVMVADLSGAMSKAGVAVNIIQYGDRKSYGNPYEALPDAARAEIQAKVDASGEIFVQTVARNRNIAVGAVRDTQAGCLMAGEALKLGLVDAIMSPSAALSALAATLPP